MVVVVVAFVAFSASVKNGRTNVTTFNSFWEGGKDLHLHTHTDVSTQHVSIRFSILLLLLQRIRKYIYIKRAFK